MTHVIQAMIRGGSRIAACTSARTAAHPSTIVMVGRNHQAQRRKLPGTLLPVCRRPSDGAPVSFGRCAEGHLGTKAPTSTQPVHYRPGTQVLRVIRRERRTPLTASLDCWDARASERLRHAHAGAGMLTMRAAVDAGDLPAAVTDDGGQGRHPALLDMGVGSGELLSPRPSRRVVTGSSVARPSPSAGPPASGRTDSTAARGCRRLGGPVPGRLGRR
jgi:hypothetical protein